ncbi:anhydro-N-acetylmuramic acid kinase [Yoonia sp. SS1-5]|uniref:Anhydro-N-acetylmuramic acid kinase n=1 Tax=Yoonia rhodophyticola TaxID=3137370 RepID=A0AAN0MEJ4_9RHOB
MLQHGTLSVLGTMSGTSLDGVDAAVLETDGHVIHGFGPTAYRAYSDAEQATLRAHLGQWQGDDISAAARLVEAAHLSLMAGFDAVDLGAFHGQTLAHDPGGRGTHQCGDGARLAAALGKPVVWDFRSADVAAGGQGAPLAPFYHFALAKWLDATAPIAFLNLGGVGNITWVDPSKDAPEDPGALLAFDTGPANAPINDLMQARFGLDYDKNGALAAQGAVDSQVLAAFAASAYFAQPVPKSLDRDAFAALYAATTALAPPDAAATLTQACVTGVRLALAHCPVTPYKVLVAGGGRKNATLMGWLDAALPCPVIPVDTVGLDGDMLEAQAFAYLAARVVRGLPISAPGTTGVGQPIRGGVVSAP